MVENISRHRPLTILDNGRATGRLAKPQGPINAAAARHRMVKRRGTLAWCAMRAEGHSILLPNNGIGSDGKGLNKVQG